MFEIEDDGSGIPAETRAKLFAPFAASKGKKGSTGLGMYLCKVLVENGMRGTIEVDERQPSGVKFTVVLPLAKTEQA
jgi:signal transduction histidine kinase